MAVDCPIWINWVGEAKKMVARLESGVKNNLVVKDKDPGFVDRADGNFQFRRTSPIWEEVRGFRRIPFDKVGPSR